MGGIQQMFASSARGNVNSSYATSVTNTNPVAGTRAAGVSFVTDGTTVNSPVAAGPNWFNPTFAGIGSSWWVRFVVNTQSGTTISSGVSGAWNPISSNVILIFQNTVAAGLGTGNATISFSPDGGTTVVTAGLLTWSVGTA